MPALYRLECAGKLPELTIVGYALETWTETEFIDHIHAALREFIKDFSDEHWLTFKARLHYVSGDLSAAKLIQLAPYCPGDVSFYLALPPGVFALAATGLGGAGLSNEQTGTRNLIIEKPFGTDLASSLELQKVVTQHWKERQILRIDHFLGKETVQNILVFRFANSFVEHMWNNRCIEEVQITVAESLGLEGRYKYYDAAGALRDMLQNHLMQMFTLIAMEPPPVWDAELIRTHKVEVLRSLRPITAENVAQSASRGQYQGYLQEEHIPANSKTETYASLKLYVDNWRWKGVPFYLRSGKHLEQTYSEIAIRFREPPTRLFADMSAHPFADNWLVFRIKPDEAIDWFMNIKQPGLELISHQTSLHSSYNSASQNFLAYDQLLLDALEGDRAHFLRMDEVEWAWRVLEPVLEAWKEGTPQSYRVGSSGPDDLKPEKGWRALSFEQPD